MKFYVSGKIGVEDGVREVMKALRDAGHEITFDWPNVPHLKPYDEKPATCQEAAILETNAVKEADVLILIPHDRGVGMYVEFGIAIGSEVPVRVITKYGSKTMFFYHPLVKKVNSVEEVIEEFSKDTDKGE